ncbi:PrsW family intramembrane metalloprotease, partial [Halobacteriales archaeon QH_6_68_27]
MAETDSEEGDPVAVADAQMDLYEISTWEARSLLDRFAVAVYWLAVRTGQALVILAALAILVAIGGLSAIADPAIALLTAASVVPALLLAGYVWQSDVTAREPLSLLAATFLLAVLTAGFAAVVNGLVQPAFSSLGIVGMILFFYVVVGPV